MKINTDEAFDEFIEKITDDMLSKVKHLCNLEDVKRELEIIRQAKRSVHLLEIKFAINKVLLEKAIETVNQLVKIAEMDDAYITCLEHEADLSDTMIDHFEKKPKKLAQSGGEGRAAKFAILEEKTIMLYEAGIDDWDSIPDAATKITPEIVALSKNGNGDLLPSTIKPLQWIRKYVRKNAKK
jgi:hypothetical protein